MRTAAVARVREHLSEPLHRASLSVMVSTILMGGIGVIFWIVAARIYTPAAVGRDNALVVSMMMIASVLQLNLSNALVRFLPQVRERLWHKITIAYLVAGTTTFLGGLIFALVASHVSDEFSFLSEKPYLIVLYAVATTLWVIFVLEDPVLLALGKATWMPGANAAYSAGKLALLPLMFTLYPDHGIFVAWVLPTLLVVPFVNWLIRRRAVPQAEHEQREAGGVVDAFGHPRILAKFLFQDFVGATATQVAIYITPLLAMLLLGPTATAYYAIPFAIMGGIDLLFVAVISSLMAEGARSPERIKHLTELVVKRLIWMQLPLVAVMFLLAPVILLPFGQDYSDNGTSVIRILAIACVFRAGLLLYEAAARLAGHGVRLMIFQVVNTLMLIGLVCLLAPKYGIDGVAWGWFGAAAISAIGGAPWLIRFIRNPTVRVGEQPADDIIVSDELLSIRVDQHLGDSLPEQPESK